MQANTLLLAYFYGISLTYFLLFVLDFAQKQNEQVEIEDYPIVV